MRYRYFLLLIAAAMLCGAGPTGPLGGRLAPRNYNNPQLYPSVNGPGPGVIAARTAGARDRDRLGGGTAQILFRGPDGMNVNWDVTTIGASNASTLQRREYSKRGKNTGFASRISRTAKGSAVRR